jgi:hypothetical protein
MLGLSVVLRPAAVRSGADATPPLSLPLLLGVGVAVVALVARRNGGRRRGSRRDGGAIFRTRRTAIVSSRSSGRCRRPASVATRFHALLPLALDFPVLIQFNSIQIINFR